VFAFVPLGISVQCQFLTWLLAWCVCTSVSKSTLISLHFPRDYLDAFWLKTVL
jgi:hypothetical protein